VQEYTIELKKMEIMLGITPMNLVVLLKYIGDLQNDLRKQVMFFKPRIVDEGYVQEGYLKNIRKNK
jgi:hypothetical protein